jgi:AraC family transcriptional regulator
MDLDIKPKTPRTCPAVIGTKGFRGTVRTTFAAKSIISNQLRWPGASAAVHAIDSIEGYSLTRIKNLQLHFSWNMGYVGGVAHAGKHVKRYENRAKYLYVVASPLEVGFEMEKSTFKELAVEFDPSFLLRSSEVADPRAMEIPDTWDYDDPLCWEIASVIYNECSKGAPNGSIYGETAMTLLALQTLKHLGTRHRSPMFGVRGGLSPTVLRRACAYMDSHMGEDISLSEVCAVAGLSPGHFAYAFRRSMGISPHAWLRHQRIEKAKDLLRNRKLDIGTIALRVGYANQSAFGVAFKKETAGSPADWRRSL